MVGGGVKFSDTKTLEVSGRHVWWEKRMNQERMLECREWVDSYLRGNWDGWMVECVTGVTGQTCELNVWNSRGFGTLVHVTPCICVKDIRIDMIMFCLYIFWTSIIGLHLFILTSILSSHILVIPYLLLRTIKFPECPFDNEVTQGIQVYTLTLG